eukprot:3933614-Rhodomonas_salina.1
MPTGERGPDETGTQIMRGTSKDSERTAGEKRCGKKLGLLSPSGGLTIMIGGSPRRLTQPE